MSWVPQLGVLGMLGVLGVLGGIDAVVVVERHHIVDYTWSSGSSSSCSTAVALGGVSIAANIFSKKR